MSHQLRSYTIGVCLKAENNPFWAVEVRRGIEEEAKADIRVNIRYASPERIGQWKRQRRIVSGFLKDALDLIILAPGDPADAVSLVRKANLSRIPVIILDTDLDADLVRTSGVRYSFVGLDDYRGGWLSGDYLSGRLPQNAHVGVINGYRSGTYSRRISGFFDAVFGKLSVRQIVPGDFEEEKACLVTKELVAAEPGLNAIFAASDNMAMGAVTALEQLGRHDVLVCGFDATHVGRLAVEKGRLLSTVDSNPCGLGKLAIREALRLLRDDTTSQRLESPVALVTKSNCLAVPKQVFQKRNYQLVEARPDLSEYDYSALESSLDCPVITNGRLLFDLPARLAKLKADRHFIITDTTVEELYGRELLQALLREGLCCQSLAIPPGETSKNFSTLNDLAVRLLDMGVTRRSCVVVLGGGVLGNIAGFLAAVLMRGIRFVQVPTTVVAQLDSSIGGKQAVNTSHGKNLLGTFYEPEFIFIDTSLVTTLAARDVRGGLAEAIKHALCQSRHLLKLIDDGDYAAVLRETIRLKSRLLERDPREKGEALVLLYGHTIGHAVEIASGYVLNHGESISIGMMAAVMLARRSGYAADEFVDLHRAVLSRHGLPTRLPASVSVEAVMQSLYFDKKERKDQVCFYLIEDVGVPVVVDESYSQPVSESVIVEVLRELQCKE